MWDWRDGGEISDYEKHPIWREYEADRQFQRGISSHEGENWLIARVVEFDETPVVRHSEPLGSQVVRSTSPLGLSVHFPKLGGEPNICFGAPYLPVFSSITLACVVSWRFLGWSQPTLEKAMTIVAEIIKSLSTPVSLTILDVLAGSVEVARADLD